MYDETKRVGRYGFEIQTQLLVHPEHLVFDPDAKKLGTELDVTTLPTQDIPQGWRWTADPTHLSKYAETEAEIPSDIRPWFLSSHHECLADATGYQAYWVYRESDLVGFQLELVSEPFDDGYSARQFTEDARGLYRRGLSSLLKSGVAGAYNPAKRQLINEQLSIELDDTRWKARVDPLQKLAWLGCGFYLLTRLREHLSPPDTHVGTLIEVLDRDFVVQGRALQNYDLFRSYRLLLDGYFFGTPSALDWEGLQRILCSRVHTAVLCCDYDNDRSYCLVHGEARLEPDDFQPLRREDFALFRHFGIDSRLLDLVLGEAQPHLDRRRHERHELLRDGLRQLCDLDLLESTLRAALDGGPVGRAVSLPLCHPRKSATPGCVYVEWRALRRLRLAMPDRYPTRFLAVEGPDGPLEVIFFDHLHKMAHDLATLMDVAIIAGSEWADAAQSGDFGVRERDFDRVASRFAPRLDYLLRTYKRPAFHGSDA